MPSAELLHWRRAAALLLAPLILCACLSPVQHQEAADAQRDKELAPPVALRIPYSVPSPNGTRDDPYYWLRDDSRSKPEVLAYLKAENDYTNRVMAHTQALQDKLYEEIVSHVAEDDVSVPVRERGWWYYTRVEKGREYPVLARKRELAANTPEQVMLDGNQRAQGHDYFSVGDWEASPDSSKLAWTEDTLGRFTYTIHFKNLVTGEVLPDAIAGVDGDVVWANDKTVLYVEKDPVTLLGSKVRKHTLGSRGPDPLVYEEKDHSFYIGLSRSKSERYVYIALSATEVSEWRYADVQDPKLAFKVFYPREPKHEYQIDDDGRQFVVRTNWQAPNFRLMSASLKNPADRSKWQPLIPHRGHVFIEDFELFRGAVAINERSGGLLRVTVKDLATGRERLIGGDQADYALHLLHTPDLERDKLRVRLESLATPASTYDYDLKTNAQELLKTESAPNYDASRFTTELLFAPARDGQRIPISLVRPEDFRRDGTAPLLLLGYGAYGISSDPGYRPELVSLRDRGFLVAIAHVRGGQELGRQWYEDGRLLNKQNTFNDFIDATEFLIRSKYAARDKVFARGGSAGGLLMGAIANLRPDLYRGIVAHVPFVDIVTTMLDASIPLTTNEYDEWGDPRQKVYYDYMLSYSPYDNVRPQKYPAMLVTTGLWDSQVQYYEPAKWVAKLRASKQGHAPLILRVNLEAGHHGKSGRYQKFHEDAFEQAFVLDRLGIAQ